MTVEVAFLCWKMGKIVIFVVYLAISLSIIDEM